LRKFFLKLLFLRVPLEKYIYVMESQKYFFLQRTWLIKLFEFGSTKSQRQINAANPDVRNKIKTISAFLLCQTHISLFPTAYSIFPSSWLNIFFLNNITLWESSKIYTFKIFKKLNIFSLFLDIKRHLLARGWPGWIWLEFDSGRF